MKLVDVQGGLFASPGYLAEVGTPMKPTELERHRLLAVHAPRGLVTFSMRKVGARREHRVRMRAGISATDYRFFRSAAVEGGGIAILPRIVAASDVVAGMLVRVLPDHVLFEAATYLVYPTTRFLLGKVRVFRDFMIQAFA